MATSYLVKGLSSTLLKNLANILSNNTKLSQIASNKADQALLAKIVANFNYEYSTDSVFICSTFSNSFS